MMKIKDRIVNGIRLSELKEEPVKDTRELMKRINAEGAVLLENNGMLPLKKGERAALFGRCQFEYYKSGSGSGGKVNAPYVTQIYDSMKALDYVKIDEELAGLYKAWLAENPFDFAGGWCLPFSQKEMPLSDAQIKAAADRNDKAIVIIGRTAGEDKDNAAEKGSYLLSDAEYELLKKVSANFKEVCVVLNVSNIIDMKWAEELNISAILYVWQGGQDGGEAVAELLCGMRYPSGKLSDTIAYDITDYPSHKGFGEPDNIDYSEDIYVGYRYFETFRKDRVMYPFGYGLSYTEFDIKTDLAEVSGDKIKLEVCVKNIGKCKGKEVVQVYFEGKCKNIGYPARQLIAFEKTKELARGESQKLSFEISADSFAAYDDIGMTGNKACCVLDEGEYNIYVGNSVRSAEFVCRYTSALKVIKKLSTVMPLNKPFERLVNNNGREERQKLLPEITAQIPTVREIPQTGDKGIKLCDVYNGYALMESFIAQLDDFQLACLSQGEGMNSPKVRAGTGGTIGGLTKTLADFGIPAICLTDGPSGLRFDNGDKATSLPNGTLLACTWNRGIVSELYSYEGMEAYANRVDGLLGPGVNIHRYPLCGRNFEYLSEDPYLTGIIGGGICEGLMQAGVSATVKHFSANNKEANRKTVNVTISERALREIYFKPFEMIIKEGKVKMLMTAYNQINGVFCSSSYDLNTRVLREEWGYDGLIMTDWWPRTCYYEGEAVDSRELPIKAQNDVFMVNANAELTAKDIMKSLAEGKISRGELQRNAINICRVIMSTPTFERYLDGDAIEIKEVVNTEKLTKLYELDKISSGEKIKVSIDQSGEYAVGIEYCSVQSDLMQFPVNLYINNVSAALYMINGTNGKVSAKA
ncbi:MAG: glycoside hydrolase family 3 protein, partial [Clostridia bacterium]|nr:glycoside hydrolase family 3 protein [Clostridia bacterium]